MLFNSWEFIFLFLPITLLTFWGICRYTHHRFAIAWLVAASLFFYGWWNPTYLTLLIFSIVFNYGIGVSLSCSFLIPLAKKLLLTFGIVINLALLSYFKYANFFVSVMNSLVDTAFDLHTIVLPLAISFFTFQQIAYLVDSYRKKTQEYGFLNYCLFVVFFHSFSPDQLFVIEN